MRSAFLLPLFTLLAGAPSAGAGLLEALGLRSEEPELAPTAVERFHAETAGEQVWKREEDFRQLLAALEGLSDHGLNPEHYHLDALKREADDHEDRDRLATDAWFSAAAHLLYGKLDPRTLDPDWTAAGRTADLGAVLKEALRTGTVSQTLSSLAPRQPEYAAMMAELRRTRALTAMEIAAIPPEGKAKRKKKRKKKPDRKAEERREKIRTLQKWLAHLDPVGAPEFTGEMDEMTVLAVAVFQKEAGLPANGVADQETADALARAMEARENRLRVNMERWRWLPDDLGRRHVRANIAGFSVTAFENERPVRTHAAIVGKLYRRTPVFSESIKYVVLNPWWETPPSLASTDQLELFIRDPEAPGRMGFQVIDQSNGQAVDPGTVEWSNLSGTRFPYRLRQAPGPENPLGRVKIMFPNAHNVYLHDTPLQGLFAQRQRAFSSGCIRVQFPIELTEWLLAETEGWDRKRIDETLASGAEKRVNLAGPVPVHILYLTVTVEESGAVRFLDDLYDRDRKVLDGLDERLAEA